MQQDKLKKDAKKHLDGLCKELDRDNSSTLTEDEFMQAFDSPGFREVMSLLGIDREDLQCVFRIMDKDCSGDVSYSEFTDLLYKMKVQNSRTMLLFIEHYAMEIR